jgi:hypothetical protein
MKTEAFSLLKLLPSQGSTSLIALKNAMNIESLNCILYLLVLSEISVAPKNI